MIVFADKQDITRVGLIHVADSLSEAPQYCSVEDKATLIETLNEESDAVVYLDYTMFDINDVAELQIIAQRFPNALWVLFCDELSYEFINQTVANNRQFGIVMKDSPLYEIRESMMYALRHQRFICQRIAEMLLNPPVVDDMSPAIACLTKTETEILKLIAMGLTTKEIAERRFSSFHTVNTHRKNIFRKLGVNNAHEATKLALRAGVVDSAEYYI
ncbi:response regulator transcription factor [Prevotella sp.]|uniref:response regulator transcription factor n=1 Tax=Prevotella sp. TaxID=59823 RepID=UPI0027E4B19F|nr:response regulator transcription factor [Prevotella sp.]